MSKQQIIPTGTIINGYEVVSLLGIGGYAGIYKVKKISDTQNHFFAMKVESLGSEINTISTEVEILKNLKENCFPKLHDNGTNKKLSINFYVMDLYGTSIDVIHMLHRKQLATATIYNISFKMLEIIETFHSHGFVHRDIKPGNFLIQNNPSAPLVLTDFGISQKHINPSTNKPHRFRIDNLFTGTRRYASIAACEGYSYGRRDDLISWFYSFIDLACGYLPWDEAVDFNDMLFMKNFLNINCLGRRFPKEITTLYKYIKRLKYGQNPDYDHIKQLFVKSMQQEGAHPNKFNWNQFYLKHANLEVLTRELSLKQKQRESQKEKEKMPIPNKKVEKAASSPSKLGGGGGQLKKSNTILNLFKNIGSKSTSAKESKNKKKNANDDSKKSNEKTCNDKEKVKPKKKPPIIPNKIGKK